MKKIISIILVTAIMMTFSFTGAFSVEASTKASTKSGYDYTIKDAVNILKYLAKLEELDALHHKLYKIDPSTPYVAIGDAVEILKFLAELVESIESIVPLTNEELEALKQSIKISVEAAEIVKLVNGERAKIGLPPLLTSYVELNSAANQRAFEISNNYRSDHSRPDGSPWHTILDDFNVDYRSAGENIAMGYTSPKAVTDAWMNSDGHRKNILSDKYTHIGVGVAKDSKGVMYWTQIFVGI